MRSVHLAPMSQPWRHRTAHDPVHFVPTSARAGLQRPTHSRTREWCGMTRVEVPPSPTGCDFRLRGEAEHEREGESSLSSSDQGRIGSHEVRGRPLRPDQAAESVRRPLSSWVLLADHKPSPTRFPEAPDIGALRAPWRGRRLASIRPAASRGRAPWSLQSTAGGALRDRNPRARR